MEAPEDTDSSSDVWDVRHIQLQPVDSRQHYVDSGYAGSYNTDNGNRKPSWEKKGYGPDDTVTDWAM